MCGLAGLIHIDDAPAGPDDESAVQSMCDLLAYRGPDHSGIMSAGGACMGSRRLAILDLSPAGNMPMTESSGRWWIAYNGEIYNFADIRRALVEAGVSFQSNSDTEVVLQAWIAWGPACLDRFVGMFAFAIYDRRDNELTLVRDRFGIKPIYWTQHGRVILFASELKALISQRSDNRVNQRSLDQWWLYRNVDALTTATLIEGIQKIMPGQFARIRNGRIEVHRWYSAVSHVSEARYRAFEALPVQQVVDSVEEQLDESVRLRLVSDVPVGTLLSGGLDSSLVTAMAARHSSQLSGFHISIAGHEELDESRFARSLADSLRIPFFPVQLTAENFRARLAHVTWLEDMPLTHANSVGYHLISQVARQHGTIVVLTGEGADELFGGYAWSYRRQRLLRRLKPWLDRLPARVQKVLALLVYMQAGLPVNAHQFRALMPSTIGVLDQFMRMDALERCTQAYDFLGDAASMEVSGSMLADLADFLTPLLRRLDRTTMGASVEARVPFLDHRLVHTAINLPLKWKIGRYEDKWILKQIARNYLPESLIWRRKMGFPLPLAEYIAPLATPEFFTGGFCEETLALSHRGIARVLDQWKLGAQGIFGLIGLEIWGRTFLMGESTDRINERIESLASARRGAPLVH
ncbi:MAG TPA: asparagine synthase (glutamine-hydrolyzing) [Steroidobacteraceae bacterium]|nr:asparagine synthase (glutamine-hydrolyzing) [Steroidobacteraceae bacterium]